MPAARDLRFEGQSYGDINARKLRRPARPSITTMKLTSAGSNVKVTGNTPNSCVGIQRTPMRTCATCRWKDCWCSPNEPISLHAAISLARRISLERCRPRRAASDLDLANAALYGEPIDHVRAKVSYLAQRVDVHMLEVVSGPSRIELNGRYDHPAGSLNTGDLQFR